MEMGEFKRQFARTYKLICTIRKELNIGMIYPLFKDISDKNSNFAPDCTYALSLIRELSKIGINANFAYVPTPSLGNPYELKAVVAYFTPDGQLLIADPVEDIRQNVTIYHYALYPIDSCKWGIPSPNGLIVTDNSCYSPEQMANMYGTLTILVQLSKIPNSITVNQVLSDEKYIFKSFKTEAKT